MFENSTKPEYLVCKERLEKLRKHLCSLIDEYDCKSENVQIVSNELDECILLYMKLNSDKCGNS
ncbi:MAG: hypothetical protein APF77_05265 [Clostridia bacterium BRH_c25]|nr:MAG: hypothetical protein APF77_05265 [Clostridia bacterium BRH_c25]